MTNKKQYTGAPIKALLDRELDMTQAWDADGCLVPLTVVQVDTNVVTQVHTDEVDGYSVIQLGFGEIDSRKVTKPLQNHSERVGVAPRHHLVEVRTPERDSFEPGRELDTTTFEVGGGIDVSGTTKGEGFAGVMKRHGFAGVSTFHGTHRNHHKPDSIGACAIPGCIFKGLRMVGRTDSDRRTVQNLTTQVVDAEKGLLLISGAISDPKDGVVLVRSSAKGV